MKVECLQVHGCKLVCGVVRARLGKEVRTDRRSVPSPSMQSVPGALRVEHAHRGWLRAGGLWRADLGLQDLGLRLWPWKRANKQVGSDRRLIVWGKTIARWRVHGRRQGPALCEEESWHAWVRKAKLAGLCRAGAIGLVRGC